MLDSGYNVVIPSGVRSGQAQKAMDAVCALDVVIPSGVRSGQARVRCIV